MPFIKNVMYSVMRAIGGTLPIQRMLCLLLLSLVCLTLTGSQSQARSSLMESTRIELNSATKSELTRIPGIGPARAKSIIRLREKRPFRRKQEIMRVRGIGHKMYKRIKDLIYVDRTGQRRTRGLSKDCPPCPCSPEKAVALSHSEISAGGKHQSGSP